MFRLEDLKAASAPAPAKPAPAKPAPARPAPAKPAPQAARRGRDQATAPVSLPEMKRALDDFQESDQTIVDAGSATLLAQPAVTPASSPGTNPDATRPMVGPDLLMGKKARRAEASFEDDEQTFISPPELDSPVAGAPSRASQEH